MSRHLPARPNLDHLRKQAKELLLTLRQRTPSSKLADAQYALAREYGFADWPSLKAHVAGQARHSPLVGTWSERSALQDDSAARELRVHVVDDSVTITEIAVGASSREEQGVTIMLADGRERPSEYGYALAARWRGAYALDVVVAKAGQQVSRVTYEVSRDGGTLTVAANAEAHSGYPLVSQVTTFSRVEVNAP